MEQKNLTYRKLNKSGTFALTLQHTLAAKLKGARQMKTLFTIITLIALSFAGVQYANAGNGNNEHSTQTSDTTEGPKLKVLSWNIYMLPPIVARPGKKERAYAIVEQLKKGEYDVIVFQEAFLHKAREIISTGLDSIYKYTYGPANSSKPNIKTSSGVWVISKTPLRELGQIEFSTKVGIDKWARKGALMLEGEFNGNPFQVLGTHLQSENHQDVREKQMDQIYIELISKYKNDGVPQIICGDMNTENDMKEHYCHMLNCLDAEDGAMTTSTTNIEVETYDGENNELAQFYGAKKKNTLDYILLRANGKKIHSVQRYVSVMKKGKKHLSDHYGVVCEVKF